MSDDEDPIWRPKTEEPSVPYHPRHRAEPLSRRPMGEEQEESEEKPEKESHEIDVAPSKHWLRPAFLRRHPSILLTMLLIAACIIVAFAMAIFGPR